MKLSATYRNNRLQRLTDVFGRQIEFAYTTLAAGDAYIKACLFKSRLDGVEIVEVHRDQKAFLAKLMPLNS